MKKILATVLGVVFAMFAFAGCNMAAADGTATGASGITSIVMMVVIIAVFYFLMIVPEKKRKKKAQEMRDSIEVGDKIVTIGGMVGKVVHVTGDSSPSRPAKTASASRSPSGRSPAMRARAPTRRPPIPRSLWATDRTGYRRIKTPPQE